MAVITCTEAGVGLQTIRPVAAAEMHTIINKTLGLIEVGIATQVDVGKGGVAKVFTFGSSGYTVTINSGQTIDFTADVAGLLSVREPGAQLDRTSMHIKGETQV